MSETFREALEELVRRGEAMMRPGFGCACDGAPRETDPDFPLDLAPEHVQNCACRYWRYVDAERFTHALKEAQAVLSMEFSSGMRAAQQAQDETTAGEWDE